MNRIMYLSWAMCSGVAAIFVVHGKIDFIGLAVYAALISIRRAILTLNDHPHQRSQL